MGRHRKWELNEDCLNNINTEEKAYFLGFMYADGSNSLKTKIFHLTLQEEDLDILQKIAKIFEYNGPIYFINKKNARCKNMRSLSIYSNKLTQQLNLLGCTPSKTLTVSLPTENQIPSELFSHFIRGYLDGDGSICCYPVYRPDGRYNGRACVVHILSSRNLCLGLQYIINSFLDIPTYYYQSPRNHTELSASLKIWGQKNVINFLDWIYDDATIYLKRKHEKYIEIKEYITLRKN